MLGIGGRGSGSRDRNDEEPLRIKDEDERRALLALACEHDRVDILQNLLSGGDGSDGGGGSSSASVAASPPSGGGGGLDLSLLNRPPDSLIAGDDDYGDEEGDYDDEGEEGSASSGEYESGSDSSEGSYYSDEEESSEYEDEEGYDSDYSSDAAGPKFFVPPLHVAVASGSVAAASSLLRVGADPSVQIINREAIPEEGSMAKFRDEGIGGAYTLLLLSEGKKNAGLMGLSEDIVDRLKHAFAAEALRAIGSDEVERVGQLLSGGMPSDASVAGKDLYGWALDLEAERCGRMLNPDRWDGDVASRVKAREEEERRLRGERAEAEADAEREEEEEKKRDRSPEVVAGRQRNGTIAGSVDAGGDGPPRTPTKSEGGGPPPPPSSPYESPERERAENDPAASPASGGAIGHGSRGRVLRPSSSTPLDALRTLLEEQGLVEAQLTSMRDDLIDERDLHEAVLYEAPDSGLPPRSPRRSGTHREGLLQRVRGLKAARAQRETEHEFYRERWMEAEDELAYLEQEARFDPAFRDLPMYQEQHQQQEQRRSPHVNGIGGPGAKGDGGTGARDEGGVGQVSAAAPQDEEEERAKLEGLVEASQAKVSKLRASVAELAERNAGTASEVERLGLDGAVRLARSLREELREVERAASAARAGEARCRERIEWHNRRRAQFLLHRQQERQKRELENGGSRSGHAQEPELEPASETASMAATAVSNGQNGGCANGEEVHAIVAMAAEEVEIGANVDQKMSSDEASRLNNDINGEDHPAGRSRDSRDLDGPINGEKRQRGGKDVIENKSAHSSDERGGAHAGGKPETEHRSYVREEKDKPQPASASIATGDSTEIAVRTSARYMSLDLWDLFWRIMGLGREAVEKSKPKSRDSHNRNVMIV